MRKKEICGGRKEIEECHKYNNEDLPAGQKKNAHKKKDPKKNGKEKKFLSCIAKMFLALIV